jgi:hypothetical protein
MNKAVPILLLLILISLLGGFLFMYYFNNDDAPFWKIKQKQTATGTYEEQIDQEKLQAEKDAENYNLALQEKRLSLCENIGEKAKKDECRDMISASEAMSEKNPELCTTLSSLAIRERCLDNITYFRAEEAWDTNLCKEIQDETIQSQCMKSIDETKLESHIASGSLDISFCDSISDSTLLAECKKKIMTEKDSEFYREAIANTTLVKCDNITDTVTRSKCRDAVLFDLALKEWNLDYCSSIEENEKSEFCRRSLLGRQDVSRYQQFVRTGNLESCNELTVIQMKNQCRDTIIYAKVRETRDETLCELLYNTGITEQCREMVSEDKK